MVESEAKELPEEIMLGAVMFGHRHFQPVIEAIIKLAEKAAKEPRDFTAAGQLRRSKRKCSASSSRTCARPTRSPTRRQRHEAVDAAKAKVMAHFFPRRRRAGLRQAARRRRVQGARSQDRPLEHPRHRQAHRRPRPQDRAPDRRPKSASCRAPTARRCSPAARPRRWWSPRSAPARTSSTSTRCRAPTRRRSCCTTTSRPTRSARPAAWAARPPRDRPRQARLARDPSDAAGEATSSPTRSASSPRSPSRTARPRWRPCAAPRWR